MVGKELWTVLNAALNVALNFLVCFSGCIRVCSALSILDISMTFVMISCVFVW